MAENSEAAEIACSLSDQELQERRAAVRKSLLPHIVDVTKLESGLRVTFPPTRELRATVEKFISLERQCCGFLNFRLSLPEQGLVLTIDGPPEAEKTLDMFAATLSKK